MAANVSKTTVLITGANSGIGFETVRALYQSSRSYHIYLGSRDIEKGNEAKAAIESELPESTSSISVIQVDVLSDESIRAAYAKVGQETEHLDVLVNNAGHSTDNKVLAGDVTMRQAWNEMYDTNVTGAHIMTFTFAPILLKSRNPRIIFLASGLSQIQTLSNSYYPGPPPKAGWPKRDILSPDGYRTSKTALNMMMLNWHWMLQDDGVKTWGVSPGWLATNLGGNPQKLKVLGAGDPAVGGMLVRQVIEGERDGDVGKVVTAQGIQSF